MSFQKKRGDVSGGPGGVERGGSNAIVDKTFEPCAGADGMCFENLKKEEL